MWEYLSLEEYVMGEEKFNEKGSEFSELPHQLFLKIV